VVDHPRTPTFCDTGAAIEPDLGIKLGTGSTAFATPDGEVDVLIEVKFQHSDGTVIDKIERSITRAARIFTDHGVPYVIVHDLDARAAGPDLIAEFERQAHLAQVGFIATGSLTREQLVALVRSLLRRRAQLRTDRELDELIANLGQDTVMAAARRLIRTRPELDQPELPSFLAL